MRKEKNKQLFSEFKKRFDYIVIDKVPVGLVADAFLLEPYADISIFAVRHDKTPQILIKGLEQMRQDGKLEKPAIVLNGI